MAPVSRNTRQLALAEDGESEFEFESLSFSGFVSIQDDQQQPRNETSEPNGESEFEFSSIVPEDHTISAGSRMKFRDFLRQSMQSQVTQSPAEEEQCEKKKNNSSKPEILPGRKESGKTVKMSKFGQRFLLSFLTTFQECAPRNSAVKSARRSIKPR